MSSTTRIFSRCLTRDENRMFSRIIPNQEELLCCAVTNEEKILTVEMNNGIFYLKLYCLTTNSIRWERAIVKNMRLIQYMPSYNIFVINNEKHGFIIKDRDESLRLKRQIKKCLLKLNEEPSTINQQSQTNKPQKPVRPPPTYLEILSNLSLEPVPNSPSPVIPPSPPNSITFQFNANETSTSSERTRTDNTAINISTTAPNRPVNSSRHVRIRVPANHNNNTIVETVRQQAVNQSSDNIHRSNNNISTSRNAGNNSNRTVGNSSPLTSNPGISNSRHVNNSASRSTSNNVICTTTTSINNSTTSATSANNSTSNRSNSNDSIDGVNSSNPTRNQRNRGRNFETSTVKKGDLISELISKLKKQLTSKDEGDCLKIGTPTNVTHNVHLDKTDFRDIQKAEDKIMKLNKHSSKSLSNLCSSSDYDKPICVICISYPPTHVLVPCGHKIICDLCVKNGIVDKLKRKRCMTCNSDFREIIKVYE